MDYCSEGMVPYHGTKKLSKEDCPKLDTDRLDDSKFPYAYAVRSLMYVLICTRPDLSFSVGVLSIFQSHAVRAQ